MTDILYSLFQTDEDAETSGKWVFPAGEGDDKPAFKIARAGGANKKFNKLQTSLLKPHAALFRNSGRGLSNEAIEIAAAVAKQCFMETVLLDWKNVKDTSGTVLPFSKENAEMLMKKLPALYDFLMSEAQAIQTFNSASLEDESGN